MTRKPNARVRHSQPPAKAPAPASTASPSSLALTGDRAKLYRDISARYVLEDGSAELLLQSCQALERAAQLAEQVNADGAIVRDRFGSFKPHPAVLLERDYRALGCRTLSQLVARMES
jgi:hypothetical protein